MPELPEVQTVVNTLRDRVITKAICAVTHLRTDMVSPAGFDLAAALGGRRIVTLQRRAKRIVFSFDNGASMFIHLGMTGRLTLEQPATLRRPHTHFVATLCSGLELRLVDPRRFGGIVWLGDSGQHSGIGPEPLTMRPTTLHMRLRRTRRAIKTALLDQTIIAGIGNIYADEALHRAGISPTLCACDLDGDAARRLNRAIKYVLRRAIRAGGSSLRDYVDANGQPGYFQTAHRVYGREGQPCRACKTPIVRIIVGGRSTHFCPYCQPKKREQDAPH